MRLQTQIQAHVHSDENSFGFFAISMQPQVENYLSRRSASAWFARAVLKKLGGRLAIKTPPRVPNCYKYYSLKGATLPVAPRR